MLLFISPQPVELQKSTETKFEVAFGGLLNTDSKLDLDLDRSTG